MAAILAGQMGPKPRHQTICPCANFNRRALESEAVHAGQDPRPLGFARPQMPQATAAFSLSGLALARFDPLASSPLGALSLPLSALAFAGFLLASSPLAASDSFESPAGLALAFALPTAALALARAFALARASAAGASDSLLAPGLALAPAAGAVGGCPPSPPLPLTSGDAGSRPGAASTSARAARGERPCPELALAPRPAVASAPAASARRRSTSLFCESARRFRSFSNRVSRTVAGVSGPFRRRRCVGLAPGFAAAGRRSTEAGPRRRMATAPRCPWPGWPSSGDGPCSLPAKSHSSAPTSRTVSLLARSCPEPSTPSRAVR
mmetsp:Transcript_43836/g.137212  ORF Transcript_43836/g.137212 Transcript_43836/m.137212 type:complete len:324 (-) Transcript_43836:916-1887(-)